METLIFTIVNRGKANLILKKAKELGAKSGTILRGEGTVQSKFFEALGIAETSKDILIIHGNSEFCDRFYEALNKDYKFYQRNKGIAISVPFLRWSKEGKEDYQREQYRQSQATHVAIFTIVDKGKATEVMDAAREAGAKGGTILHGHGAGVPTDYYFPLMIEPAKDIVLIVTTLNKTDAIRRSITKKMDLDKVGTGVMFSLPVVKSNGLYDESSDEKKGGEK